MATAALDPDAEKKLLYRLRVLHMMLGQGIALGKLQVNGNDSELKILLEEGHVQLLSPGEMSKLITDLSLAETTLLVSELESSAAQNNGKLYYTLTFDGTSRIAECFAVVIRFNLNNKPTHRLLSFDMLKHPMLGKETGASIINTLRKFHLDLGACVGANHDRASVNGVGIEEIIGIFAYQFGFQDSPCWSHTIDNAGKRFKCDSVLFFMTLWNGFFANSLKAKSLFKEFVGMSVESYR